MILDRIIEKIQSELPAAKLSVRLEELESRIAAQPPALDFCLALQSCGRINVIAEAKKASPSRGVIRTDFDPAAIARTYAANGACAISVLTEQNFFQGSLEYLRQIRREISLPLLRKDFIIDSYQVYEARAAGADAFLLIAAVLEPHQLNSLVRLGNSLGMHALVEVHTEEDLLKALKANSSIIGINNRNLNTFTTDIAVSLRLRPMIPAGIVTVSESGISSPDHIRRLRSCGIDAFLVGESLMREPDPGRKLAELLEA